MNAMVNTKVEDAVQSMAGSGYVMEEELKDLFGECNPETVQAVYDRLDKVRVKWTNTPAYKQRMHACVVIVEKYEEWQSALLELL